MSGPRLLWLVALLAVGCAAPVPKGKPGTAVEAWIWHSPIEWSANDTAAAKELGVSRLLVRGGTLSYDGAEMQVTMPVSIDPKALGKLPVDLVYNMDQGAIRHSEQLPAAEIADTILAAYRKYKFAASAGLQLDFDFPTRRLGEYAEILKSLRQKQPGIRLTMTGLQTWMNDAAYRALAQQVDAVYMQFYEGAVAKSPDDPVRLSNLDRLRKGIGRLESVGRPYYVGVPTYGQCLAFDAQGKRYGVYRGMGPTNAMRNPRLKLLKQSTDRNETRATFEMISPDENGRGLGFQLVYRMPEPELVNDYERTIREHAGSLCQGIAIFRWPEPREAMALNPRAVAAIRRGETLTPEIEAVPRVGGDAFEYIESPDRGSAAKTVDLVIRNTGLGDAALRPDAITVEVALQGVEIGELERGSFDGIAITAGPGKAPASRLRGDRIEFHRGAFRAGDRLRLGPISLRATGKESGQATVTITVYPKQGSPIRKTMPSLPIAP